MLKQLYLFFIFTELLQYGSCRSLPVLLPITISNYIKFHLECYISNFIVALSSLLADSLSSLTILENVTWICLSVKKREATQLHTLLSVCEQLYNKQSQTDFERRDWSLIVMSVHLLLFSDCGQRNVYTVRLPIVNTGVPWRYCGFCFRPQQ